jgi:hypothetical protein
MACPLTPRFKLGCDHNAAPAFNEFPDPTLHKEPLAKVCRVLYIGYTPLSDQKFL